MDDASDVIDELIDRFGDPPPAVEGLVEVALLRNQAAALGIYEIAQRNDQLLLYWDNLDMHGAARLSGDMRGRIMVNAGAKPYLAIKLPNPNTALSDLKKALLILTADAKEQSRTAE